MTHRPWMLRAAATAAFSTFAVAQAAKVHRRRPGIGAIRWATPGTTMTAPPGVRRSFDGRLGKPSTRLSPAS
ncbi:hypothetical protein ACFZAE_25600 [Streptomyces scabiei]|uniref:hypothetical protein n=1 Tax=Streptomyces scabiei TaxID=1930 RepID=UPI0036EF7A92